MGLGVLMLTSAQIKQLNRARDVCAAIGERAHTEEGKRFAKGQLAEACMAAELAIFNVLNLADVPEDDLHNRKETPSEPAKPLDLEERLTLS